MTSYCYASPENTARSKETEGLCFDVVSQGYSLIHDAAITQTDINTYMCACPYDGSLTYITTIDICPWRDIATDKESLLTAVTINLFTYGIHLRIANCYNNGNVFIRIKSLDVFEGNHRDAIQGIYALICPVGSKGFDAKWGFLLDFTQ